MPSKKAAGQVAGRSAAKRTPRSTAKPRTSQAEKPGQPDPVRERYEDLVDDLQGIDGVTPPPGGSGFGRGSLRYRGKIFAMLVRGSLVVKLPAARVGELIESGAGTHFDANKGTPMKEWLCLDPESATDWLALAREALDFAQSAPPTSRRR